MTKLYIVLGVIVALLIILTILKMKSKNPGCGIICQLLQKKPSLPKKPQARKEKPKKINKRKGEKKWTE